MRLDTDTEWERWGQFDPYFGVITHPKFRRAALDDEARKEFFESGERHVEYVLQVIRTHIDAYFRPKSVLDFGCGVGRTLIPFSRVSDQVMGLDVSPSMLAEAASNCAAGRVTNVGLELSDDRLTRVRQHFDLVHSFIVFQHLEPERGRRIFGELIRRVAPGGVGAVHVLYSKSHYAATLGVPTQTAALSQNLNRLSPDPEMQMNAYGATEVMFTLQSLGVQRVHVDFSDHGGELGMFLFFLVPASAIPAPEWRP